MRSKDRREQMARAGMRETLRAARDGGSSSPLTELSRSRVSRGRTSSAKKMFLFASALCSRVRQQVRTTGAHADCRLRRTGVAAGAGVTSESQARTHNRYFRDGGERRVNGALSGRRLLGPDSAQVPLRVRPGSRELHSRGPPRRETFSAPGSQHRKEERSIWAVERTAPLSFHSARTDPSEPSSGG